MTPSRLFLLSLLSVSLTASSAVRAQAAPSYYPVPAAQSVYSVSSQALRAAQTTWGTASLVVGGSGAGAAVATAAGTFLGLTPVGWAGVGVAVLAATVLTGDSSGNQVAYIVNAATLGQDPLPGIVAGSTVPTVSTSSYYTLAPVNGGVFGYLSFPTTGVTPEFTTRIRQYLSSNFSIPPEWVFTSVGVVGPGYIYGGGYGELGKCPTTAASCVYLSFSVGTSLSDIQNAWNTYLKPGLPVFAAHAWTWGSTTTGTGARGVSISIPLVNIGNLNYSCGNGGTYDYALATCLAPAPSAGTGSGSGDGKCQIGWTDAGLPYYDKTDTDCGAAPLMLSPGSGSVPPSVSVTDPASGHQLTVSRPSVSSQGVPGAVVVSERIPDFTTNSTITRSTTTAPATTPNAPPASSGSSQQVYPGTGTQTSSTAASNVSVLNWPSSLDGLGSTMSQLNSQASSIANNTLYTNTVLQQISGKLDSLGTSTIDTQVPVDAVAPPAAPADLTAKDHKNFLQPLKDKLAEFASFEFPAHASSCPSFAFNVTTWGVNYDVSSTYMCDWLADHRTLLAGLMYFTYLVTAILIVLGA